jgi:hypothetical protein
MWFKIISQLNNSDQISLPRLSIRVPALLLKRFRRREAELFPSRHVQLPCLSARLNRSSMEPSTRLDAPPMFLADRRWTLLIWFSGRTAMLSAQLVRSDENCPSTDRPMPTTAIFNPTRPRHIKHCPYRKLDHFVRCDQSRRSRLSIRRPAEQSGGQRPVGCVPATTSCALVWRGRTLEKS